MFGHLALASGTLMCKGRVDFVWTLGIGLRCSNMQGAGGLCLDTAFSQKAAVGEKGRSTLHDACREGGWGGCIACSGCGGRAPRATGRRGARAEEASSSMLASHPSSASASSSPSLSADAAAQCLFGRRCSRPCCRGPWACSRCGCGGAGWVT